MAQFIEWFLGIGSIAMLFALVVVALMPNEKKCDCCKCKSEKS